MSTSRRRPYRASRPAATWQRSLRSRCRRCSKAPASSPAAPITVLDYRDFRVQLRPVRVLRNEDHECAQSHPHHRSKCRAGFDRCNIEPPKRPFLALFWNGQHGGAAADHERPKTYLLRYVDGGTIFYKNDLAVQHAQPTDFFGNPCNVLNDLFINNCNYDAAGQLLPWISGTLPPHNTGRLQGIVHPVRPNEFRENAASHGLASTGWLFAPRDCANGQACRLHIVFHGCKQYQTNLYFSPGVATVRFGPSHSPTGRPAISRLRAHLLQRQDDSSLLKSCRNTGRRMPFASRSIAPRREA
jgi:hypothetical protein